MAPWTFLAERAPFWSPYFHTLLFLSNLMLALVRRGSTILGIFPWSSWSYMDSEMAYSLLTASVLRSLVVIEVLP